MIENKGKKTDLVAYGSAILFVSLFVAVYLGIITADEAWKGAGVITAFAVFLTSKLSKDATSTHSDVRTQGTIDPVREVPDERG